VTRRTERVAGELRGLLARLLREEVSDPRIGLVSITRVDVAPDMTNALVFWSTVDRDADEAVAEACAEGLESAAPFLRRRAAREFALKRMPELRFRYDPSLALGTRTLDLLRDLEVSRERETAPEAQGEAAPDDET
jgi:ribosome-binding factor A